MRIGTRVGILVGLQSVDGPQIGQYGRIMRTEEYWKGQVDYVVRLDDSGEELVYPRYLLSEV